MTTHAPARPTDRPIPSPFTGAGKLWLSTFLSHILNPWHMAFALLLPLFMYAIFGMTEARKDADRIVIIDAGKVLLDAPTEQVVADNEDLEDVFERITSHTDAE